MFLCAIRHRGLRFAPFLIRRFLVNQFIGLAFVAGLFAAGIACAQEPSAPKQDTDIALLKKQMLETQAALQQMQAQHQQEIDALKTQIENQQKIIADLQKAAGAVTTTPLPERQSVPATSETALFPTTDPSVVTAAVPSPAMTAPSGSAPAFPATDASVTNSPEAAMTTTTATGPTAPIAIAGGGRNYLNLSLDGIFAAAFSTERQLDRLEVGDHDPQQRGFNARNIELALDGAVDPYFEAFANIVFKLDNDNETEVEVEEAFMQTTTLPWGLQLKGGQFFAPFGRINSQHPHVWDFADAPLIHGRLLGPDGLRGVGAQVSWVMPFTWYSQFSLAVQNGQGGTGYSFRNRGEDDTFFGRETIDRPLRGVQDFVFIPRWESSFDLTPTQTVLVGVCGAFGPNDTGPHSRTQIYGTDIFYKWKPANAHGGFPFVKWQTEGMLRRFEAGRGLDESFPESETFNDWGVYSQVVCGFRQGWTAGLRGDYLHMDGSEFTDDPDRTSRWRASLNLTWYPTEFSKLRLQYNHDFLADTDALGRSNADSVFLQFEFSLGAHAAHKF
jgi:hypothetical protein